MMNLGKGTDYSKDEAAHSIAWSADLVRQIPELKMITRMLGIKQPDLSLVHADLKKKLDPINQPSEDLCQQYIQVLTESSVTPNTSIPNNDESVLERRFQNLRSF